MPDFIVSLDVQRVVTAATAMAAAQKAADLISGEKYSTAEGAFVLKVYVSPAPAQSFDVTVTTARQRTTNAVVVP